jgi:lipopolysaccharide/colanic/teichoic acid biosynthesis glycosyltransferase
MASTRIHQSVGRPVWLSEADGGTLPLPFVSIPSGEWIRRLADIAIAATGLIVSAPLLILAAVMIKLDSPGPALYWQERIGRFGHPFRLVKLRTMVVGAEADGQPVWAQAQDPRVTRVGALLRRSHLDEVPQFWNVLCGEMSLIGPRPERPEFVAVLAAQIPMYQARHAVRPGLTGWAQVQYKYGSSVNDAVAKLEYDLYYVHRRTLLLDLLVVVKTIIVTLRFSGV